MSHFELNNEEFCLENSIETDEVLKAIYRDTWVNVMYPQMLTNELQGKFLTSIAQLRKPTRILEIGTFTGYSAICMARGLSDEGKLIAIEKNAELEQRIRNNIALAQFDNRIELLIGDATVELDNILRNEATNGFDMIYIDADKENYPLYLQKCYRLLNSGGILLADNVFWGGKMADKNAKPSKELHGIKQFLNDAAELEWNSRLIVPIGDGLFMGVK
jgi:predicted O-methyltransferase YrrM